MKKFAWALIIFLLVLSSPVMAFADMDERIQIMGNITIASDEVVPGDVVSVMGNIQVDGIVHGDVVSVMGNVTINGKVHGDIVSVMGNATINGEVLGNVTTTGGNINKGPDARIQGSTTQVGIGESLSRLAPNRSFSVSRRVRWGPLSIFNIMKFLGIVATAALAIILFPQGIKMSADEADKEVGKKLLMGFLCLSLLPVFTAMMIITIFCIPLIPVLFILVAAAGFYGYIGISIFLGRKLNQQFHLKPSALVEYILGALPLWLIQMMPFFGWLASLIVLILSLGITVETRFGTKRSETI